MSDSRSHGLPTPGVFAGIVIAMFAMIAVPAAITLHTVHQPVPLVPVNQNATPQGYTVSLLLFILPIVCKRRMVSASGGTAHPSALSGGPLPFSFRWASYSTSSLHNGSSSTELRSNVWHSRARARQICAGRRVHLLPDRLSRSSSFVRVARRVLAGRLQPA